jgi:hypothetical protein
LLCLHFSPSSSSLKHTHTHSQAHHSLIDKLRTDLQLFGPDLTTWNSVGRTHALSLLLHCADISNSLREYPLCMQWTKRVMAGGWGGKGLGR